ncbi:MAG: DUF2513 domain-containing protein [Lacipirellulaceae bacterium]
MKRDLDLARQLLLEVEGHGADCPITDVGHADEADERVRHHVRLLVDDGLLKDAQRTSAGVPCVRLTNAGHEFLETAASEPLWREAKWLVHERTGAQSFVAVRELLSQWAAEAAMGFARGRAPLPADVRFAASRYVPFRRFDAPYYGAGYAAARYVAPRYVESRYAEPRYVAPREVEPGLYDAPYRVADYRVAEPLPRYGAGTPRRYATPSRVASPPLDWRDRRDRDAYVRDLYAPRYATPYVATSYRNGAVVEAAETPRYVEGYDRAVYRDRAQAAPPYRGAYGVEWLETADGYGASLPVHVV